MVHEFSEVLKVLMPSIVICSSIFGLIMILGLISYILRGVAIYKMSVNRGISHGWLGFIPYAHNYQLGEVAGEIEFGNKKIKNTGLWLLLTPIVYGFVVSIGYAITMLPYIFKTISLGPNPAPEEAAGSIPTLMISTFFFVLVILFMQVFYYLFRYLALHKIFSMYSVGQKPVFYLIWCICIPLASSILLFIHRNRPLLETKETTSEINENNEIDDETNNLV